MTAALFDRLRADFASFVASPDYPCLGARSSLRRGGCTVQVYGPMGDVDTTTSLARDLSQFVVASPRPRDFVAFAAMFAEPAPETELEFETALWRLLSSLAAADHASPWAKGRSSDTDDPHFAFSLFETPFFVIGLHPASSRIARRLSWPALVFNPHAQFERLRAEDRFESMRGAIRARDIALQGDSNPNLADAGERSEARQYSGRRTDGAWACPFHHPREPGS